MKMTIQFYAISLQPARVVATEVDPAEAAVLLDAGHSVLLAAPTDLVRAGAALQQAVDDLQPGGCPLPFPDSVSGDDTPAAAKPPLSMDQRFVGISHGDP